MVVVSEGDGVGDGSFGVMEMLWVSEKEGQEQGAPGADVAVCVKFSSESAAPLVAILLTWHGCISAQMMSDPLRLADAPK